MAGRKSKFMHSTAFLVKATPAPFSWIVRDCSPDFSNELSWTPVELVAGTFGDLLLNGDAGGPAEPVYHIDNPVRQPWKEMVRGVLAPELGIPQRKIVPFKEWIRRVRHFVGSVERDNPAYKLIDFPETSFERMSCG